jgi:hypothetical protein
MTVRDLIDELRRFDPGDKVGVEVLEDLGDGSSESVVEPVDGVLLPDTSGRYRCVLSCENMPWKQSAPPNAA